MTLPPPFLTTIDITKYSFCTVLPQPATIKNNTHHNQIIPPTTKSQYPRNHPL